MYGLTNGKVKNNKEVSSSILAGSSQNILNIQKVYGQHQNQ